MHHLSCDGLALFFLKNFYQLNKDLLDQPNFSIISNDLKEHLNQLEKKKWSLGHKKGCFGLQIDLMSQLGNQKKIPVVC